MLISDISQESRGLQAVMRLILPRISVSPVCVARLRKLDNRKYGFGHCDDH